jgi:hypothetical protein
MIWMKDRELGGKAMWIWSRPANMPTCSEIQLNCERTEQCVEISTKQKKYNQSFSIPFPFNPQFLLSTPIQIHDHSFIALQPDRLRPKQADTTRG